MAEMWFHKGNPSPSTRTERQTKMVTIWEFQRREKSQWVTMVRITVGVTHQQQHFIDRIIKGE